MIDNIGQYVYMIAPKKDFPIRNYTLVSTQMRVRMARGHGKPRALPLHQRCPTPHGETALFDVKNDPAQETRLDDPEATVRLRKALVNLMKENDAPAEIYDCYGLK